MNLYGNQRTASIWQNIIATKVKIRFSGVLHAINGFNISVNMNLPTNTELTAGKQQPTLHIRKTSLPGNLKRKFAERPSSKAQTSG
jgi:hypothetical protein